MWKETVRLEGGWEERGECEGRKIRGGRGGEECKGRKAREGS